MKTTAYFLLGLMSMAFVIQSTTSARILVLYLFGSKSHKNFAIPIVEALAEKGHEIVFVSPYREKKEIPGIKQVILDTGVDKFQGHMPNMFEFRSQSNIPMIPFLMLDLLLGIGRTVFTNPEIQALTKTPNQFDLILCNGFINEISYGLLHTLNAPVILLEAASVTNWQSESFGSLEPLAHVPNIFLKLTSKMNFFERTLNVVFTGFLKVIRDFYFLPHAHAEISKYYKDIPGLLEVERNSSLILTNGHYILHSPRPQLPAVVDVGGIHCVPPKPLPKDLAEFVASSGDHGFILFSFGSVVQGSTMPDKLRNAFLEVFSKLPQKVIWKWETETMESLPPNVKLSKWVPQQDLLGHPKCRAFITHGGLLSTQEATYHGVPVVGIPFYGDQDANLINAEYSGYGIKLELNTLSKEIIADALNKVLGDKRYRDRVTEISKIFRDQPISPRERAVFWVEYVIRHKGARHLRPSSMDLNWFQMNLLDVFLFLAVVVGIILYVLMTCMRFTCKKLCGTHGMSKRNQKKQKSQ